MGGGNSLPGTSNRVLSSSCFAGIQVEMPRINSRLLCACCMSQALYLTANLRRNVAENDDG